MRNTPDAFVRRSARPAFRTMTTGTTGRPTSTYFSAHEMQTTALLSALTFLQEGQIGPDDIVQISTSSRATLGNTCFSQACQRIGAAWYLAGLVQPAQALALLAEEHHLPGKKPRASFLNTYPSYLGELVECGLAAGYRPADFGLERISVGGEVVTAGLKARAQQLFGPVAFIEGFGMTEIWPLGATRCAAGHLHWEPTQGLIEVLNPETSGPAQPGEAGTLVATPFGPYREASVVLRYDTEDVVAPLAGPLTCRLADWPATSDIQGKLRLSVRHDHGWTYPRDVLEALEAVEAVPLPARCGFWAVSGGVAVEAVVRAVTPAAHQEIDGGPGGTRRAPARTAPAGRPPAVAASAAAALRSARGLVCHAGASDRSGCASGRPPAGRKVVAPCLRPRSSSWGARSRPCCSVGSTFGAMPSSGRPSACSTSAMSR